MKIFKKVLIGLVAVVLVLCIGGFGYVYSKLNSIYEKDTVVKNESSQDKETKDDGKMVEGITNVLLVGVDGNNIEKGSRSDSVMLATIDNKNKELKITSIARDTFVDIPGYSTEKLTHAYAYGGIDLLREVFKTNFDIQVDKYVAVNFASFIEIMDEIGGVEVNVEAKDVDEVNKYIDACYTYYEDENEGSAKPKKYVTKAGKQRLNGYQALAFSRIRYTDSAYARDNRHREVAQSVYNEFLTQDPQTYKRCADILLNNTKTNISPVEMMDLGFTVYKIADSDIAQLQFPLKEYRKGHIISKQKGWVLEWDKEPNLDAWHKFIFGE